MSRRIKIRKRFSAWNVYIPVGFANLQLVGSYHEWRSAVVLADFYIRNEIHAA